LLVVPLWFRYKWTLAGNDFFGYLLGALVILPTWAAMVALHAVRYLADAGGHGAGLGRGHCRLLCRACLRRHKLAPAISPGKTWEGVAGAVVGVLVYGGIVFRFSPLAGQAAAGLRPCWRCCCCC
jgi:phosphatidate cytidylyltransferase